MKRTSTVILCALVTAVSASCASGTRPDSSTEIQPATFYCERSPWCNLVAVEKPWPEAPTTRQEMMPVMLGPFRVQLPRNVDELHTAGASHALVANYANYRIALSLETVHDFGLLAPENNPSATPENGRLHPFHYFEILFTKTPADPEPAAGFDRKLWRAAFVRKSSLKYSRAGTAEIRRHGTWTAYSVLFDDTSRERETILVNREQPDDYLRVYDTNAPESVILSLVATTALSR